MQELQEIEYNGIYVLTTQQISEAYGTDTKVITNNFSRNKDRYVEGKHYICLTGDDLRDYRAKHQNEVLPNANKLYLWTQKGTFLHAKSLNTDTAWEVYDRLVDNYFDRKDTSMIDTSKLSPELQLFNQMFTTIAQQELEQKRQAEQLERVEKTVTNMKEIFTTPIGDWKSDINAKVREISIKSGIEYQELYTRMYGELENTAHCSLKRLRENKKNRMEKAGNTKTAIKEGTTSIAVIFDKPQLKAIFEGIVKKYAMSYCT